MISKSLSEKVRRKKVKPCVKVPPRCKTTEVAQQQQHKNTNVGTLNTILFIVFG